MPWTVAASIRRAVQRVRHQLILIGKLLVAVVLCGLVLPLLTGVLLDLIVIIPMKVPGSMSPWFSLPQDWAVGLMVLKLMQEAGIDGPTASWKEATRQISANGWKNIQLTPIFTMATPLTGMLLTAIALPYWISYGLMPHCGVGAREAADIFRWSYPSFLLLGSLQVAIKYTHTLVMDLCHRIRDDNYLVGETLLNIDEGLTAAAPAVAPAAPEVQA
jgi:E3 ubiquitin-protein ligase MARCH6